MEFNIKEINKYREDMIIYGTGILYTGIRKWYNPIRWIKGLIYQKRIHPKNFYR